MQEAKVGVRFWLCEYQLCPDMYTRDEGVGKWLAERRDSWYLHQDQLYSILYTSLWLFPPRR